MELNGNTADIFWCSSLIEDLQRNEKKKNILMTFLTTTTGMNIKCIALKPQK